jgi:glycosyltransferase involved in cell wall biosynthesis
MNICLYTPSFLPRLGGMETVVDRLARQFQAKAHQVLVLAKTPRENPDRPQLPYEVIYYPRSRSNTWLLGPARRALLEEHRRRRFDVIHAHQAYPNGYVAVKAALPLGLPVVITPHGGDLAPTGRYRQRFIPRRRMCWAMRHAQAVTAVSSHLKDVIDQLTGGRARATVIPNGVDLPQGDPGPVPPALKALGVFWEKPFMLTLGRLHGAKGLDVLLEALALLRSEGKSFPHLVIAGDGKDRPSLEQQAARCGLAGAVTFVGTVLGREKDWLLHHGRFFLQPSRSEGMPLTVLEAMAHGRAVIGTAVSGMEELVHDGYNGLKVPPEDPAALARAIADLAGRNDLTALETGARATAEKMSWSAIAERYLSLFQSCGTSSG